MSEKFYIVQKSNWQGDNWKPVAGPFVSRQEAKVQEQAQGYHPHRATGGIDIQSEIHAKVISRTDLTHLGYPNTPEGRARLAKALFYASLDE